MVYDVI